MSTVSDGIEASSNTQPTDTPPAAAPVADDAPDEGGAGVGSGACPVAGATSGGVIEGSGG